MTLLHICCGPCAVYPTKVLKEKDTAFDAYFFNPNIHPKEEHERRKRTAVIWAKKENVKLVVSDQMETEPWMREFSSKKDRCRMCYEKRIKAVFDFAAANGYDTVTSTLLVSPYQDHDLIKEIFDRHQKRTGIIFLYIDFRKGFREGQRQAAMMELYRQKYCGCLASLKESSYMQRKRQNS